MKVDIRIDPACGEPAVTITAPALTDEIKALAARLEGGAALVGWDGGRAVPLEEADILGGHPPLLWGGEGGQGADSRRGV